jgi:Zn-dependent protease with chaperone function
MHAVWAIGVWGSVAGSILLLLRMRWAFHAFVLSLLGAVGSVLYTALSPGASGATGLVMPLVIVAACLFFIWYASLMTKRGVLR